LLSVLFLLRLFYCISLSLFHLFLFLFYSFCGFTFFFCLCLFHVLIFLCLCCLSSFFFCFYEFIYLFCFLFLVQKNSSFPTMFSYNYFFEKAIVFCLIRCRFEVWRKKTNLNFSSMDFFLFLLLSVLFLLRLFYCISPFMFKYIYFVCFHFYFIF
jgi:hypothetical protein